MNTVMIIVSVIIAVVAIIRLVAGIWFTYNIRV